MKNITIDNNSTHLFTADFHIENNKNLKNILQTCDWIYEIAKKEKVNIVNILGDFINAREKIDSLALNKAVEILNKFHDFKVVLLLGNHERYTKSNHVEITSIRPFEKHAFIIDKFKVIETDKAYLYYVPHLENKDAFNKVIKLIYDNWCEDDKKKILLAHQEIAGAMTNDLYHIKDHDGVSHDILDRFDKVLIGHYHARQNVTDKISYLGSPLQLSFGEEGNSKGVTIWNSQKDEWKFIENPNYQCYKTVFDSSDSDVKDKFVRFAHDGTLDPQELDQIKKTLYENGATEVFLELRRKEIQEISKSNDSQIDLKELTKKYCQLNCGDLNHERLFEIGAEIKKITEEKFSHEN